jgi:cytochrome c-type biogenesis protein CcmE
MKKIHFIGLGMIVVAIFLLSQVAGDMSTYATFKDADKSRDKVKVAGQLAKDKEIVYNPEVDPNYTSFYMRDAEGAERKIVLLAAKPQDFELSEQLVLTGKMDGDTFVATDMLTKCPSKYKDEEVYIKSEKKS